MPSNNNPQQATNAGLLRLWKSATALFARFDDVKSRIHLLGGTAVVAGDFVLSANWDATGTVTVTAGSTDLCGQILITAAGTPGANPTCTFTFKDGAWTTAPTAFVQLVNLSTPADVSKILVTTTTTTAVITYVGTPTAAHTYLLNYMFFGKDSQG